MIFLDTPSICLISLLFSGENLLRIEAKLMIVKSKVVKHFMIVYIFHTSRRFVISNDIFKTKLVAISWYHKCKYSSYTSHGFMQSITVIG